MTPEVWNPGFELCETYYTGVGPKQDDTPLWDKFPPAVRVFKGVGRSTRTPGWPGPYDQKAGLAQSKFIIVDMFARTVQGESAEAAVAWAENELKQIYARGRGDLIAPGLRGTG